MANISEIITLGIGTPSTIPYLVLTGLGIGAPAVPVVQTWTLHTRSRGWTLASRSRAFTLSTRSRGWTVVTRSRGWTLSTRSRGWTLKDDDR